MRKKGQIFVRLIVFFLAIIIFIFGAPIIADIIGEVVGGMGTATAFVVKSFLWVILLVFIAVFYKIVSGGEGFFV